MGHGSSGVEEEAIRREEQQRWEQRIREREEQARRDQENQERQVRAEREARERADREAREARERAEAAAREAAEREAALAKAEREAQEARERAEAAAELDRQAREKMEKDLKASQQRAEAAARAAAEQAAAVKKAQKEVTEALGRAETAIKLERAAQEDAIEARKRAEEARVAREEAEMEARKAQEAVKRGIAPVVWPTQEQIAAAKAAIHYSPDLLHFAVCGTAGSGKSSLINALRGVLNTDMNEAAEVGVVESTLEMKRYPDPRTEFPYTRFVWYDIPGAGTLNIPDWQYFIDQRLFIFDFIVMVYDVRFTKIDVGILEHCLRFKIPVFVVRSKADQHIENMVKIERKKSEEEEDEDDEDDEDGYETLADAKGTPKAQETEEEREKRCRGAFIQQTRENFSNNLRRMVAERPDTTHPLLLSLDVYVISSHVLHSVLTADRRKKKKAGKLKAQIIDETRLVQDMIKVAVSRRYPEAGSAAAVVGQLLSKLR